MTAVANEAAPRAWPKLNAAERRAGIAALGRAVDELVAAGGDRGALEVTASIAAAQLVLADGQWRLSVERPRFASREMLPEKATIVSALLPCPLTPSQREDLWVSGEFQNLSIVDGLRLLAGPQSPEAELARRREDRGNARAAAAAAKAASDEAARQREDERARWRALNAGRLRAWAETPRAAQELYVVASEFPAFSAMLNRLAELIGRPPGALSELPDSFRPERGRR